LSWHNVIGALEIWWRWWWWWWCANRPFYSSSSPWNFLSSSQGLD